MIFSVIIKNMLEKNENIFYFDAHFHLADCVYDGIIKDDFPQDIFACTCSHSKEEWEITERFNALRHRERHCEAGQRQSGGLSLVSLRAAMLRRAQGPQVYLSYGLHPQSAGHINVKENVAFLENLLQQHKLHAIGEAGFDYFNEVMSAEEFFS